jgi:decaprenylphospho-beta-D-ribofuranose 2-oxidase
MPDPTPRPDVSATRRVAGWGGTSVAAVEIQSENLDRITRNVPLTRGLGRSYGDSSLPPPARAVVASSLLADRLLGFDPATGVLRAEAGYSLRDLYLTFLRRGWFTPVSPGTQFVTLGGMVAADVHGKNHHSAGSIGRHVRALRLRVASGEVVECSRDYEPDLFRATVGGMGLTGHILEVELQLARIPSPWILGERWRVPDIDAFMASLKQSAGEWPFTMGWIDCLSRGPHLGRGVMYAGRWATPEEAPAHLPRPPRRLAVPITCPDWVSGRLMARAFNEVIYRAAPARRRRRIVHPEEFFYPLDSIRHWNRLYGKRGFTQHQCVLPESAGPAAVHRMMELLTELGGASFLCVIKDCGDQGEGLLSFPMRGVLIALDLPIRDTTPAIVDRLNEYVVSVGGRIYLAKDTFTRAEHFRAMEPRLDEWLTIRRVWDPHGAIRSAQSVRLLGDHP